jgi:germination protein M
MQLRFKQGGLLLLLLTLMLALAGCGLFGKEAKDTIDAPVEDESYVEEGESLDENATSENTDEEADETADLDTNKQVLYLFDKNGYVVPQTFDLPAVNTVARQALEYMVKDGPITSMLPDGFQAVLPAGTEVNGVDIQEGVAVVDFSSEFESYNAESEKSILEAITFTLTQFDTVNTVKLRIDGKELNAMPVNGTPIGEGVSRANGINLEENGIVDIQNSETVTLYFLADKGDNNYYYVPVTRRVKETDDIVKATIEELIKGPSFTSVLQSDLNYDVELLNNSIDNNGVVLLNFNKNILSEMGGEAISDHVLNSIVLSITDTNNVEQVAIKVDGSNDFLNAKGEEMTEPVSRPESVNTVGF